MLKIAFCDDETQETRRLEALLEEYAADHGQDFAHTSYQSPVFRAATAIPSAAEIELEACPHVKVSYSLSIGLGKGLMPCNLRLVEKHPRRPVSILCP